MRKIQFLPVLLLFILGACHPGTKTNDRNETFGIYQNVKTAELPASIMATLKSMHVKPASNAQQVIIGYITQTDSAVLNLDLSKESIRLVKSHFTVDAEQKFHALVAVRKDPVIVITDISKTKPVSNRVEIYFNTEGTKKWAELTKQETGNTVIFVISNQVYSMPVVNGVIQNGIAVIEGLDNNAVAQRISSYLNSAAGI